MLQTQPPEKRWTKDPANTEEPNEPNQGGPLKRYNLALPTELYSQIQLLAEKKGTTVLEILKRFIKLGLLAAKLEDDPNAALIIRQGSIEKEIVFI